MAISVTILGSNSAIPTLNRRPTAQLVNVDQDFTLIDCGEGTQIQLRKYGIKFQRISRILISHMHGDHYFGLIGLVNTMHLLSREKELHIYAPSSLQEIINLQLKAANSHLRFPVIYHELNTKNLGVFFENNKLTISNTALSHRIDCFGFIFQEKVKELRIKQSAVDKYKLSIEQILKVKGGENITLPSDRIILNSELTLPPARPLKYSFISDTKPNANYYEAIKNSDLLYHEATFMADMSKRAKETFHSTTIQAAEIALNNQCEKLIIGHFSSRYDSLEPLLNEAKEVFKNTELAVEGAVFEL